MHDGIRARLRLPDRTATGLTIAALVGLAPANYALASAWWLRLIEAVALLAWGRSWGLSWPQLGLAADRLGAGLRWALGSITLVAVVFLVAVLLPLTRPAFLDSRYHAPLGQALVTVLVVIPLGTVVLEEIAFRSLLWGMLARHTGTAQVLTTTSLLFGLWHLLPSLRLGSANAGVAATIGRGGTPLVVVAAMTFTAVGGAVLGELRRRSGSVLASAGAHWATNALGVLFGLLAWSLAR